MYLEKYHSPLKENIEKTQTDDNFMQLNIFPASHRGPFVLPTEPYGIYTMMVLFCEVLNTYWNRK